MFIFVANIKLSTHDDKQKKNIQKHLALFCIMLLLILCSCKENRRTLSALQIVTEWTGKEILFPEGILSQSMGKDTIGIDFSNPNYKILLYVDSAGCSSCRLRLSEWKQIMEEADSLFSSKVDFLFFFQPKKQDEKELEFIFRQLGFQHPVFIDTKKEIDRINKFPSQTEYQCFLLDRDNKVLMIGNPSINTGIWQLFKGYISEKNSINQGKKAERLAFFEVPTLPPVFPLIKKGGSKCTELI